MTFKIVKLRFRQPVHFSRGKMDTYESSDTMLHSDTIQAALYVAALQLHSPEVAEAFRKTVRVSSAFPYTDADGCWLPKPMGFYPPDAENSKELKKLRFLRSGDFQKLMNGVKPLTSDLLSVDQPEIWKAETTQRVLLDRLTLRGMPFYLEKLYPVAKHKDRGLYFIVEMEGGDFPMLQSLMEYLSDTGFGLQRSLGNGVFEFSIVEDELKLDLPTNAKSWVNLSLFRPSENDLNNTLFDNSYYQLTKRGGWIASPEIDSHASLRKKSVMMFSEGSVLSFKDTTASSILSRGEIENLKPEWVGFLHPIWRDGRAIFLPIS